MATRNTPPPVFSEDISWLDYKKELKIWQALTDLPAKKQGPNLYLSLTGKAREAALELDIAVISKDDGLEKILERWINCICRTQINLLISHIKNLRILNTFWRCA